MTLKAVQGMANQLTVVSAERVAEELRKILTDRRRRLGMDLIAAAGLRPAALPETMSDQWPGVSAVLERLSEPVGFPTALAAVCGDRVVDACNRLKLSNADRDRAVWLQKRRPEMRRSSQLPPHRLKPVLAHPAAGDLMSLLQAEGSADAADFVAMKLAEWPAEVLDPPPLLTGDDLKAMGLTPGPAFGKLLSVVRDHQLDGVLADRGAALEYVRREVTAP